MALALQRPSGTPAPRASGQERWLKSCWQENVLSSPATAPVRLRGLLLCSPPLPGTDRPAQFIYAKKRLVLAWPSGGPGGGCAPCAAPPPFICLVLPPLPLRQTIKVPGALAVPSCSAIAAHSRLGTGGAMARWGRRDHGSTADYSHDQQGQESTKYRTVSVSVQHCCSHCLKKKKAKQR